MKTINERVPRKSIRLPNIDCRQRIKGQIRVQKKCMHVLCALMRARISFYALCVTGRIDGVCEETLLLYIFLQIFVFDTNVMRMCNFYKNLS